jgi:hypothetical protein
MWRSLTLDHVDTDIRIEEIAEHRFSEGLSFGLLLASTLDQKVVTHGGAFLEKAVPAATHWRDDPLLPAGADRPECGPPGCDC